MRWTPVALLALVAFVLAFPVMVATLQRANPYQGRGGMHALPQPVSLTIVFVLVVPVMAGLGQAVARTLRQVPAAERLPAGHPRQHRRDRGVLGAVLPRPAAGGLGRGRRVRPGGAAAALRPAGGSSPRRRSSSRCSAWSRSRPADVVALQQADHPEATAGKARDRRAARTTFRTRRPARCRCCNAEDTSYFYPYRHVTRAQPGQRPDHRRRHGQRCRGRPVRGSQHVDAVEIDPVLLRLGQAHPDHPYQNSRVTMHTDDGRAFLQNTTSSTT